jgi:hypothetical protein
MKLRMRMRINPLYFFILFLPLLLLINVIRSNFFRSYYPVLFSETKTSQNITRNTTQSDNSINQDLAADSQITTHVPIYLKIIAIIQSITLPPEHYGLFYVVGTILVFLPIILLLLLNDASIVKGALVLKYFIFFSQNYNLKQAVIPINNITQITILSQNKHSDISELSWNDKVKIKYVSGDSIEEITIDLYLFPRFKIILEEILNERNEIPLVYKTF